jgi:hypothetical protein
MVTRNAAKPAASPGRVNGWHTKTSILGILLCQVLMIGCHGGDPRSAREPLDRSAWVEDAAVQRGYIKPGDFAQFGCPPGWMSIDETATALRGHQVSTRYVGTDPRPIEGTITCVAQREFAFPAQSTSTRPATDSRRRPLTPVWLSTEGDGITIGFARELSPSAPIYIGQDTPCGPRLIGVELGDLLAWLADPHSGPKRHFLGMISGGCPEQNQR